MIYEVTRVFMLAALISNGFCETCKEKQDHEIECPCNESNIGFVCGIILLVTVILCVIVLVLAILLTICLDIYQKRRKKASQRRQIQNPEAPSILPIPTTLIEPTSHSIPSKPPMNPVTIKPPVFSHPLVQDTCPICLENGCDVVTYCRHYFHYDCLRIWLESQHNSCPYCRKSIDGVLIIQCQKCKTAAERVDIVSGIEIDNQKTQPNLCRMCVSFGDVVSVNAGPDQNIQTNIAVLKNIHSFRVGIMGKTHSLNNRRRWI